MKLLAVEPLAVADVKLVRFTRIRDERGSFAETLRPAQVASQLTGATAASFALAQLNESTSVRGVVRGLHVQSRPYQGKLVRAVTGAFLDVALDIRRGSPSFGCAVVAELREDAASDEGHWVWVPPGFAHGLVFDRQAGTAEYLCTTEWSPEREGSIHIASPEIDWSRADSALAQRVRNALGEGPLLSPKDAAAPTLATWQSQHHAAEFVYDPAAPFACRAATAADFP